jgi:hypothetical protein
METKMRAKQTITTHDQLLDWLERDLLASEPKRPINSGIVEICLGILVEVRDVGHYRMHSGFWVEMIEGIFLDVIDSTSSPQYPVGLIGFGATAWGEIIENGEITIEDVNRILIEILRYREKLLRIRRVGKHRYLESTRDCVRKCGTEVRVKLRQPERWHSYLLIDERGSTYRILPHV